MYQSIIQVEDLLQRLFPDASHCHFCARGNFHGKIVLVEFRVIGRREYIVLLLFLIHTLLTCSFFDVQL